MVPTHAKNERGISMRGPKAGASSSHSKRWRAKPAGRNIAKRLERVRLAGAFVGSWSQCATKKPWRLPMNRPSKTPKVVECASAVALWLLPADVRKVGG